MKVGGYRNMRTTRTGPVVQSGRTSASPASSAAEPARQIADTQSIAGIPAQELTPKVQAAISSLLAEVESLREEVKSLRQRAGEMEKLADQDPLTPVANRRAFVRDLSRMISYAERYRVPTSLIYFDINGMKQINDQLGHGAGDQALLIVADVLNAHTRDSDVVGRLGGDEFAVVLPQMDETGALVKAEELAAAIRAQPVSEGDQTMPIDIAYGVFPFQPGDDASATLAEADRRMYERKRRMKADAA